MKDLATPDSSRRSMASALFALAGGWFIVCAALYNRRVLETAVEAILSATGGTSPAMPAAADMHAAQAGYVVAGVVFIALAWGARRLRPLDRFFRKNLVEKIALAAVFFAVPVATLELALRPFAPSLSKKTSLFVRDDQLGWRMRPNTIQTWGAITVRTNANGHRGPDVPYEKREGVFRILYLGDSVTFGYNVERYQDTFPYVTSSMLADSAGIEVETVNAGVGGYSPWQQYLFLEREGIKYDPDLIVLSFVLNDVTEKFHLVRFGGSDESFQLRNSYYSWIDRALSRSGLVYQVRNLTRKVKARRRLGADVRLGAVRQERLDVETLITRADGENVAAAWEITLDNVQRIADFCDERDVPLLIVVFPFAFQVYDAGDTSAPQRRLVEYAAANGIACLDLLPVLERCYANGAGTPEAWFLDEDHLSVRGHELVSGVIGRWLLDAAWVQKDGD